MSRMSARPVVGILMLDSGPPFDVPGCAGSNHTYPFAVKRRVVQGATVDRMTSDARDLLLPMLEAATALERDGVDAIMGNCGFMSLFQEALRRKLTVPVYTSSLLLVPLVSRMLPKGKRVGILTYRAPFLGEAHFQGAGWSSREIPVAVAGVEGKPAWQLFMAPEHPFKREDLERELMAVCREFMARYPDIGALVLECTAMPPFAHRIQAECGLPVLDITTLARMVAASIARRPFTKKQPATISR